MKTFGSSALSQLAHYCRRRWNGSHEALIEARKKLKTSDSAYRRLLNEHEGCFRQISAAEDAYNALSDRHQELTVSFAELKRRLDEEKSKREQLKKVHQVELREGKYFTWLTLSYGDIQSTSHNPVLAACRAEAAERKTDAIRISHDKLLSKLGQRNGIEFVM